MRPSPLNHDAVTFDTTDAQTVRPYKIRFALTGMDALRLDTSRASLQIVTRPIAPIAPIAPIPPIPPIAPIAPIRPIPPIAPIAPLSNL